MNLRVAMVVGVSLIASCSGEDDPVSGGWDPDVNGAAAAGRAPSDPGRSGAGGAGTTDAGAAGSAGEDATGAGGADGAEAGANGSAGEGPDIEPCPSDELEPAAFTGASVCDPEGAWAEGSRLVLPGDGGEILVAVTPDERTVVWYSAAGPSREYFVADRAASDSEFETSTRLSEPSREIVPQLYEALALSADGLTLAVTSYDHAALLERTRESRGEPFGEPSEGSFSALNAEAQEALAVFGSVALAPDGQALYYTLFGPELEAYPLRVSRRTDPASQWPAGELVESCEFKAYEHWVQHPTAMSSDGLTLFYEDSARQEARAAFRASADEPFVHFVDLGHRIRPQPNENCARLYYSDPMTAGIFVAAYVP